MNFPKHLIHWTRLYYNNITSRVLVNRQLTDPFPIRSGVTQGCSLAPLLYVIYLEPFLRKLRARQNIQGYHLPGAQGERIQVERIWTTSPSLARIVGPLPWQRRWWTTTVQPLVNRGKSELYLS